MERQNKAIDPAAAEAAELMQQAIETAQFHYQLGMLAAGIVVVAMVVIALSALTKAVTSRESLRIQRRQAAKPVRIRND